MSEYELKEINFICVYCKKINRYNDLKMIFDLMKNPIVECQNCNKLLEIKEIDNTQIIKTDDDNLI